MFLCRLRVKAELPSIFIMGQRNYRRLLIKLWPLVTLAILVLFFSIFLSGGLAVIERPMSSVGVWVNGQWSKWFPNKNEAYCLSDDSELLKALAVDQAEFSVLKIENENLREQLGFFERQSFRYVSARIIKRSALPTDTVFVIDRGSDDGIVNGSAVVVANGHLIGKVIEVKSKNSVVQSVLGYKTEVAVSLLNSSRTIGLCQGTGGALLSLLFIPQDEIVAVNDLVVTSGLEEAIPPGLTVGVVTDVKHDQAAPFQTATVEPLIDSRQYNVVSVIVLDTNL